MVLVSPSAYYVVLAFYFIICSCIIFISTTSNYNAMNKWLQANENNYPITRLQFWYFNFSLLNVDNLFSYIPSHYPLFLLGIVHLSHNTFSAIFLTSISFNSFTISLCYLFAFFVFWFLLSTMLPSFGWSLFEFYFGSTPNL